ncbi:hypothetical protein V5799_027386 [Amblyomma americanum]|uniref:Peptidase M41 domain-containing protein n=1 Tax=Amblyomma americanum TaxID=6943 RepID=A0AAQ4DFV9_AMBAM
MAYAMIHQYGMDPVIGPLSFPAEEEGQTVVGRKPYSRRLANTIDEQARLVVARAYKETERVLQQNSDKLKLLAGELLKREVLNYADIEALIGPPPFGKKQLIEVLDLGPDSSDKKNSKPSSEREGPHGKPQQNLSGATGTST